MASSMLGIAVEQREVLLTGGVAELVGTVQNVTVALVSRKEVQGNIFAPARAERRTLASSPLATSPVRVSLGG